jgi:hypothetical protein
VMAGMPSRGIHVFWAEKVDEMLESGVMPKQAYNILHNLQQILHNHESPGAAAVQR